LKFRIATAIAVAAAGLADVPSASSSHTSSSAGVTTAISALTLSSETRPSAKAPRTPGSSHRAWPTRSSSSEVRVSRPASMDSQWEQERMPAPAQPPASSNVAARRDSSATGGVEVGGQLAEPPPDALAGVLVEPIPGDLGHATIVANVGSTGKPLHAADAACFFRARTEAGPELIARGPAIRR
jgi:hypothetical protein